MNGPPPRPRRDGGARLTRRRALRSVGVGGITAFAGCLSGDPEFEEVPTECGSPPFSADVVDSPPESVPRGSQLEFTVTVANDGLDEGTRTVELRRWDVLEDDADVSLDAGESATVDLLADTAGLDGPAYTYRVLVGGGEIYSEAVSFDSDDDAAGGE